jgi:transaldolase
MTHHQEHDPLGDLTTAGVAVWLDDLSRELLADGGLQSIVADRHVVGVTTNPTIFAAALSRGDRYNDQLADLAALNADVDTAVFTVTTDDVRAACDVLAPVLGQTAGLDGCVSIEVDPRLSRDAAATAEMARLLWTTVNRDNLYVKIPATQAYQAHAELTAGERWQRLARLGARPQRPLWASTGVKDPAYPDTKYVAGLVAPGTVNTMPGPTLDAFADHGQVSSDTITGSYDGSRSFLDQLAAAGVDFDDVTEYLERDGLAKFEKSWGELGATVAAKLERQHHPTCG